MVDRLIATFTVITPLFGGGAQPTMSAELRPPSVKGALRFWWRALAWSRLGGDREKIREQEAEIFGAAGGDAKHGQASFRLRVTAPALPAPLMPPTVLKGTDKTVIGVGARYFGQGLMQAFDSNKTGAKAGELTRPCLPPPFDFTVELISREKIDPSLVDALKLMGLLGGLGSRTRRGWGSLTLRSLQGKDTETWQAPQTVPEYSSALRKLLEGTAAAAVEPPYSAFCKLTRIDVVGENADPLHLLNTVGEQMLRYRSWGKNGKILGGQDSEKNFQDDHDWFRKKTKFDDTHPRRVIFGLPHNYSETLGVQTKHYDRRASPLLLHIQRLTLQKHIAVLTILRSAFLPQNEPLWVWQGRAARQQAIPAQQLRTPVPDWSVLDAFIDGKSTTTGKPYFPNRTPVLKRW